MAIQLKSQNVTNMYTPIELVTTNIAVLGGGGGGGVTDHGMLAGNLDNDHPQYQLTANNSVILGPYQLTVNNSLSLGTGATVSFEHTSQSTKFIAKTNSTLYALRTHTHGNVSIDTTDGGEIIASSASNGLTLSVPTGYVTVAAESDHSHGSIDIVTTDGTDITAASASTGLTLAVPQFLTTAYGIGVQGSGTYTQNIGTIQFSNSNGVTFGLGTDGVMTASIPAIGGAQTGISGIADSATTFIEGTVHYVNSNGVGFGLSTDGSNASLTASYTVPGVTVFSNSNNIEFGLAGSTITALANMNATSFSNDNNVSFGLAGSTITASASMSQSAQTFSNQTSNYVFSGFSSSSVHTDGIPYGLSLTAQPGGNNLSLSGDNTSGTLTLVSSGTAYLAGGNNVTLSQEGNSITIIGAAQGGVQTGISGIVGSDATYSSGSVIMSGQANITIGSFATSDSQYVRFSVGNYITTGAQVSHTHGSNISFSNTSNSTESVMRVSSSSNGLTMVVPKWITTAALSQNTSNYAGISTNTQSTSNTDVKFTLNTAGLNLAIPKFITTAANPTHSHGNVSFGTKTGTAYTYSSASNGLTISSPNVLTTAANLTHSHSNPSFSFSNFSSSSTASASNGLTIGVTGYPATSFVNVSDSGSIYFVNSLGSNITWGSSANSNSTSIYATAGGGTGGAGNMSVSAGVSSGTLDSIVFSNSNSVSFGLNGSTITASIPSGTVYFSDGGNITFGSSVDGVSTTITATVNASGAAGGSWTQATKTGSDIVISTGAATNTLYYGNFLTTAQGGNWTTATKTGSDIQISTGDTNTLYHGNFLTTTIAHTHDYIPVGNSTDYATSYLSGSLMPLAYSSGFQTATLSNTFANTSHSHTQYVGLGATGVTGASATVNSTGMQINIPQGSLYFVDGSGITFGGSSDGLSTTITAGIVTSSYALGDHTHSDLYIPLGNSTEYATSVLSNTFFPSTNTTKFAGTGTTVTGATITLDSLGLQLNVPQGSLYFVDGSGISWGSSVDNTSTTITGSVVTSALSSGLMPLAYSSGFQTATLSNTFANLSHTHGGTSLVSSATSNATENRMRFISSSNGLTWIQPAFLTTAMQSASSSVFAKTGFTTTVTAGTEFVGTLDTNGLKVGVPAFITTAAGGGGGDWSISTTSGTDFVISTAADTITFYQPAILTTAAVSNHTHDYQSTGDYLTTAALSNHTHSDLYIALGNSTAYQTATLSNTFQTTGAYLTTAMASNAGSNYAGIATTGITGGSATINSSQVQISMAPAGTVYFSDIVGFSFGSSTDATNTTIYLITA